MLEKIKEAIKKILPKPPPPAAPSTAAPSTAKEGGIIMSCEACIKAEEIQKLVLEIAQLKEKVKASEEREKARDLKYENLYEKQNQQLTTQALMSQQIDNIEKTLNKFIEGEFKNL